MRCGRQFRRACTASAARGPTSRRSWRPGYERDSEVCALRGLRPHRERRRRDTVDPLGEPPAGLRPRRSRRHRLTDPVSRLRGARPQPEVRDDRLSPDRRARRRASRPCVRGQLMGSDSTIEWTRHTFNPWRGCTKVSKGCANCYAATLSKRNPKSLGIWGPGGVRVIGTNAYWRQPLTWNRAAAAAGERHRVFCASLADVFEDWGGPIHTTKGDVLTWEPVDPSPATLDDLRLRLFLLIERTPHLDWLLLTKRPERMTSCAPPAWAKAWPRNVWALTSAEDQETLDARAPRLLEVPAVVRGLSIEPMIAQLKLRVPLDRCVPSGHALHGAGGLYLNLLRAPAGERR